MSQQRSRAGSPLAALLVALIALVVVGTPGTAGAERCDYRDARVTDLGPGSHPTFSADGRRIIFNTATGNFATKATEEGLRIYSAPFRGRRTNTQGPRVRCLTCAQSRPAGAGRSFDGTAEARPSGRKILYVSSRDHEPAPVAAPGGGLGQEVYVMDADGSDPVRLTRTPSYAGNYHPQWSPDGKRILWGRIYRDLRSWELLVADYVARPEPHLENVVRLTDRGDTTFYEPHGFSPDGRKVIYSGSQGNSLNLEIYTMRLRFGPRGQVLGGGKVRQLTDDPFHDEHAHYNPSGTRIAWVTSRDHPGTVNGATQEASYDLDATPVLDNYLAVPGSVLLAAGATRASDERLDIYLVRPDGTHPTKVTDGTFAADLDWSPNGRYIVFRDAGKRVGLVSFRCS